MNVKIKANVQWEEPGPLKTWLNHQTQDIDRTALAAYSSLHLYLQGGRLKTSVLQAKSYPSPNSQ